MKNLSRKEIIRISDMQDVAELLSKELKEKGYCARDCRSNSTDGKKKSPEMFAYKTTVLNYDIPFVCRLRNLAIVFYQTFFQKNIEYIVVIRRTLKE